MDYIKLWEALKWVCENGSEVEAEKAIELMEATTFHYDVELAQQKLAKQNV